MWYHFIATCAFIVKKNRKGKSWLIFDSQLELGWKLATFGGKKRAEHPCGYKLICGRISTEIQNYN